MVKTTKIAATSRASVKLGDSFYTLEYSEERSVSDDVSEDVLAEERVKLWDTVNTEVDSQVQETIDVWKESHRKY